MHATVDERPTSRGSKPAASRRALPAAPARQLKPWGSHRTRRQVTWRTGLLGLAGGLVLAGSFYGAALLVQRHRTSSAISRGIELAARDETPGELTSRLESWTAQLSSGWSPNAQDVIYRLIDRESLEDPGVRRLLTHLTGCDFGSRRDAWLAWHQTHHSEEAEQRQPQINLVERWRAPVGLTAWFSTLIPVDGQLYVPSLGQAVGTRNDPADGVVVVNGATGESRLLFSPPGAGSRDVVGLAAGDNCLFVACGTAVYRVSPAGELEWSANAGAAVAGPPLSFDVNRDGTFDAIVVTEAPSVAAFSGKTGKTLWSAKLPRGSTSAEASGSLAKSGSSSALGECASRPSLTLWRRGSAEIEIVATTADGRVARVEPRTGRVAWSAALGDDVRGGLIATDPARCNGVAGWLTGLGGGGLLFGENGSIHETGGWDLGSPGTIAVFAGPRVMQPVPKHRTALFVACVGSAAHRTGAAVFAFRRSGLEWRYHPGGKIWGTPAVADVTGDRRSDLVVCSVLDDAEGGPAGSQAAANAGLGQNGGSARRGQSEADQASGSPIRGRVVILSDDGRLLHRVDLPAGIETSPIVADVDGDQRLELLVADDSGILHCYGTPSAGQVEWGMLGGDSHNTFNARAAYAYGQTPVGFQWRWRPSP